MFRIYRRRCLYTRVFLAKAVVWKMELTGGTYVKSRKQALSTQSLVICGAHSLQSYLTMFNSSIRCQ